MSDQLHKDLDDLERFLAAARGIPGPSGVGNAQISINMGGVGLWVAVTASALSFVMMLVMMLFYIEHSRKIDDLNDYIHAIYVMAPSLKPPEKTE